MTKYPNRISNGVATGTIKVLDASINLNITPLSTASITLPDGEIIESRKYVEMFTPQRSAGIFRVKSPRRGINQHTTVDLEHAIVEVGDYLIKDNLEEETTLSKALKKIFEYYKGNKWQLGSVSKGSTKVVLDASYNSCLDAILGVLEQEPSVMLSFDFSTYPWTVNVVSIPSTVATEGRLSRNVRSASITYDDSELCTRVYMKELSGTKGDVYGHIDADTKSTYGTIEREISGANLSATQAKRLANLYLEKHKHPRLTITIDALELSKITGESIDRFILGRKCRLAVPKYNIVAEETICQISWVSVYNQPERISVTLSQEADNVVSAISKQEKATDKTTRNIGKTQDKDRTSWRQSIQSVADENGNVTAASIFLELNEKGKAEGGIDADIVKLGRLSQEDLQTWAKDAEDGEGAFAKYLTVKKLTAETIQSKIASINILKVNGLTAKGNVTVDAGYYISSPHYYIGTGSNRKNMASGIWALRINKSGNVYTLQKMDWDDEDWVDVGNFSRATTLSSEWSGGTITVTASPQGTELVESLIQKTEKWATNKKSVTVPIYSQWGSSGQYETDTGRSVWINTTPAYNAGWSAAYGRVALPDTNLSSANFIVSTPPSTADESAETNRYTLANHSKNVARVNNVDENGNVLKVVATLTHNRYNGGWNAAVAKQSLPGTNLSSSSFIVYTAPESVDGSAEANRYRMAAGTDSVLVNNVNSSGTVLKTIAKYNLDIGEIDLGSVARYSAEPSGTALSTLRNEIITAQGTSRGQWVRFKVSIDVDGTTHEKWYKLNFTA